jgi:hypothetical protein
MPSQFTITVKDIASVVLNASFLAYNRTSNSLEPSKLDPELIIIGLLVSGSPKEDGLGPWKGPKSALSKHTFAFIFLALNKKIKTLFFQLSLFVLLGRLTKFRI